MSINENYSDHKKSGIKISSLLNKIYPMTTKNSVTNSPNMGSPKFSDADEVIS